MNTKSDCAAGRESHFDMSDVESCGSPRLHSCRSLKDVVSSCSRTQSMTIQKVEWCSALAAGDCPVQLRRQPPQRIHQGSRWESSTSAVSVEIENMLPAVWNLFRVFQRKVCHAVCPLISTGYENIICNVLIHMMSGICLRSVTCTVLCSLPHSSVFPATLRNL